MHRLSTQILSVPVQSEVILQQSVSLVQLFPPSGQHSVVVPSQRVIVIVSTEQAPGQVGGVQIS